MGEWIIKRIAVTGASGLIGWHTVARLHAANCAAAYGRKPIPYDIISLDNEGFNDDAQLTAAVAGADAILHFAGVNRASDEVLESMNPAIAKRLADTCSKADSDPHIVYANSTHAASDSPYGRSKKNAGEILENSVSRYTELILPHIFGECARPFYNNVTATFIHQIIAGESVSINPRGKVNLFYAGNAAQAAINTVEEQRTGTIHPAARLISVGELYKKLLTFHENYLNNVFPDVSEAFELALFNTYRAATFPDSWPRPLKLNVDERGELFEAVKCKRGGQIFFSTTKPNVTRGNHFHLSKIERFLVVQGEAVIRIRKVVSDEVCEFHVSGDTPVVLDMPTLHTHSIENVGKSDLLTLFWTNDWFEPDNPDTYADGVIK